MVELPGGTVTMLFTDMEGSTRMLQELGTEAFVEALEVHRRLMRSAMRARGGTEVEMQGDSFHFAFSDARNAVAAACEAQQLLARHPWAQEPIRVRMGIHTGEPLINGDLYAGLDVHRAARVMDAAHGGQILLTTRTANALGAALPEGIALRAVGEHRLKDLPDPLQLFQVVAAELEQEFPPPRSLERRSSNLPSQPTPLIGRERVLSEVVGLMRRVEVRLLTLIGPGGTGKTRVALQAAADLVPETESVYFVNLAPVRDPNLVLGTIANTVGVKEKAGERLLDTLCSSLGTHSTLLLLDNFEQVTDAAPALAELLGRVPRLMLLVTSRAALHLSGEHEYAVPALEREEAVTLFAERAQASRSTFRLDHPEVVGEICRRLDDLPLAIELAAARIKLLPEQALLQRLNERFRLLTGGRADQDERQRTLRATIDWSFDLLSADEQRLFRRLAAFAGGRTLEAIERVCDPEDELGVLDCLASLLDKSLLSRQETSDGTPRFVMLETVQAYATERLERAGEDAEIRRRHAEYFLELSREGYAALRGPEQTRWAELMELEHDNFRLALEWSLQRGNAELALELAGWLWRFWRLRGHFNEGRRWLETVLTACDTGMGRHRALLGLAMLAHEQGDLERAEQAAAAALPLARDAGDERAVTHALSLLGDVATFRGLLEDASKLYEEMARVARACGDRLHLGAALYCLGRFARMQGDVTTAEAHYAEALPLFAELEDEVGQAALEVALAQIARERRDHERAFALLAEAARRSVEVGMVASLLDSIGTYALLLADVGRPQTSTLLWGAYEAGAREIGYDVDQPDELAVRQAAVSELRDALGSKAFTQAWNEGASMSPAQVVALARRAGEQCSRPGQRSG